MCAEGAGRVIVGVDRSPQGLAALRVAAREAAARATPLHAVRVEELLRLDESGDPAAEEIDLAFDEALGGVPDGLRVERSVQPPPVAGSLTAYANRPDDLLIVGTSAGGWWHALWSGSVARACVRKARCMVLVVPAPPLARELRRHRLLPAERDLWRQFEQETAQGG